MLLLLVGCIQAPPPPTVLVAGDAGPLARARVDGAPVAAGWPAAIDPEAELAVAGAVLDPVPEGVVRYVEWGDGSLVDDLVVGTDVDPDAVDLYAEPDAAWAVAELLGGDVVEGEAFQRLRAFDVWARLGALPATALPTDPVEVFPVLLDEGGVAIEVGRSTSAASWSDATGSRGPALVRSGRALAVEAGGGGTGWGDAGDDEGGLDGADALAARLRAERQAAAYAAAEAEQLAWVGLYRGEGDACVLLDLTGGWRDCADLRSPRGVWTVDDAGLVMDGEPVPSTQAPRAFRHGASFVQAGSPS